ncbi:MAG: LysR family transcriptional regulator [Alphaproteobacteria bacterium]|nr:LysR family transcriptional regulator [Alphaproteobacteria bacterium]
MRRPDLNLLAILDVLLSEGSVARAARRLRLSPSAMSRALSRLRAATGDPLLVRAGRGLVLTPRALELRAQVGPLVEGAEAALRPGARLDLQRLDRRFTLRTSDGFVEAFGAGLLARVARDAPGVRLWFVPKPDKDSQPLREGRVDLEIGVVGRTTGPEIRSQALFRDRLIGVVREGHPLLSARRITPALYAGARHVAVSRRGPDTGPIESALAPLGLKRDIAVAVGGFSAALALARATELVASVPERFTAALRAGLHGFPLPIPVPAITLTLLWHPRMDADPAHRWLRDRVREVCAR